MGLTLTKQQREGLILAKLWWPNRYKRQVFEISGAAGTGKAQPITTKIPTPNGVIELGKLKVGDYVFNRHGKPVKVLGVFDQGELDAYKITFDDGRSTICNDEHLWSVYDSHKPNKKIKTLTVRDMLNKGLFKNDGTHRYRVHMSKAVEYDEKELPIDPYVIGAFIGNGCCTENILSFSSNDIEVVDSISKLIGAKGYYKLPSNNYTYVFLLNDNERGHKNRKYYQTESFFRDVPELIGYSYTKRIPKDYLYSSIEQRWALVQGLFDTDGSISCNSRFNISYSSINLGLILDIRELLFSLGYASTISIDKRKDKYKKTGACYTLYVKADNQIKPKFFRLTRKHKFAEIAKDIKKRHDYSLTYIHNIEKLDYKTKMRCIYVDDQEHLYLTNDYIVTHNTTLIYHLIDELGLSERDVLFVAYIGKAALQITLKGNSAQTIHSAIYNRIEVPLMEGDKPVLSNGRHVTRFEFVKKETLDYPYKLIVVDEAAMVPVNIAEDLKSFGVPIIALGDKNQLPPIFGKSYFLNKPDIHLSEVMRQSADSPIIKLGQFAMHGKPIKTGDYGDSKVIYRSQLTDEMLLDADVILCGKNNTRQNINNHVRNDILKRTKDYPCIGDKLLCKQNNWQKFVCDNIYLVNGMLGYCTDVYLDSFNGKSLDIDFMPEFLSDEYFKKLKIDYNHLLNPQGLLTANKRSFYNKFEYGYAITVHAAQGSQYNNILIFDEVLGAESFHRKWLYTAITRASEKLTLVVPDELNWW